MSAPIDLWVPGEPAPQPRVCGRIAGPRHKPFIHIYTPSTADDWKEAVARYARASCKFEPIDEPLRLALSFRMPRPESHFRKSGLRLDAPVFHTNERADIDNLSKAVMDALTKILWVGDGRVCQLYAEKVYTPVGQDPGARIMLTKPIHDFIPDPTLLEAACSR